MTQPFKARPYIGLPYANKGRGPDGWDCWGLARLVLRAWLGIEMPDYGDRYRKASHRGSVETAIKHGLSEGWRRVDSPRPGALVIFNIIGKPWHVGVVVGPDRFLHMPAKETSCTERLSSPDWQPRIEGYYVYG